MKLKFTFTFTFISGRLPAALAVAVAPLGFLLVPPPAGAQETPYFVTYSHHLEQPSHLEIEFNPSFGTTPGGSGYTASVLELEYGVKGWWTAEAYLDGQSTLGDTAL